MAIFRFPDGRGAVNLKGLKYYNDVIDELVEHGRLSTVDHWPKRYLEKSHTKFIKICHDKDYKEHITKCKSPVAA